MKFSILLFLAVLTLGCTDRDDESSDNGNGSERNFKQDMRNYVIGISRAGKAVNPNFVIIPQNGIELVTSNGEENGTPDTAYLAAIDGNGQEDLFYGYDEDDQITDGTQTAYLKHFLDISKDAGKAILVTDYASTASKVADSYQKNTTADYVSYAAIHRSLDVIPNTAPHNINTADITTLSQVKNFLYLINPEGFPSKATFINAVATTNYDAIIIDLFLNNEPFTSEEIAQLRTKANGGKRMIICYMSIGEAEDYRYYWQDAWNSNKPNWIATENPDWTGNYKVKYWNEEWQGIIYKNQDSYLTRILSAGFDGVYLDIIDAFEYFEN